jgi:alanine-synthesizing transaminase
MLIKMKENFPRISQLPAYVFAEINRIRDEKRAAGEDVIDFGMGNPLYPPPQIVRDKLSETVKDGYQHGYSQTIGIKPLRDAQTAYYKRRFNVDICPDSELIVSIGSKEGISSLALAISGPDDEVIVSNPCYPIHKFGFILAGAKVKEIKSKNAADYLQKLKKHVLQKSKKSLAMPLAVVVNYPCNPTAETVELSFYEELVSFCKEHNIYIISDLAYAEIYFDERKPTPSILQVPGAKDIAVEFTSVSKTYSMAGWRIGFIAGNNVLINALSTIKSYLDYGNFAPLQIATVTAINKCDSYILHVKSVYKERRDIFAKLLNEAGWDVRVPEASMFIWTELPKKYKHLTSIEFCKKLASECGVIVSPGTGFGTGGEGFVRMSLIEDETRIREAVNRIKKIL